MIAIDQYPRADDVLEGFPSLGGPLDGELVKFEIVEGVLAFQLARELDALCANVDADDARARLPHGVARRSSAVA